LKIINNTRVGGIIFLAFSLVYGYFAGDIPLDFFSRQETFNARSMPLLLAGAGVICSVLMIIVPSKPTDWSALLVLDWLRPAALLAVMWAYASVFEDLGFAISTIAFLIIAFTMLGERRPLRMIAVAVPLVGGFWLLMDQLGIYLAPGLLVEALFLDAPS